VVQPDASLRRCRVLRAPLRQPIARLKADGCSRTFRQLPSKLEHSKPEVMEAA
jgi:hypothetical protein